MVRSNEALAQLILTVEALVDTLDALAQMTGLSWEIRAKAGVPIDMGEIDALAQQLQAEGQRYAEGLSKARALFAPLKEVLREAQ